jgi:hypothetical protein
MDPCVSDARPLWEIAAFIADAEFEVIVSERHDEALHAMVDPRTVVFASPARSVPGSRPSSRARRGER